MKRKKIIHVIGGMNIGGAETFLINLLKNIDKDKYEFVFLCYGQEKFDYEDEIKQNNARIIRISMPKEIGYIKHIKELKDVFIREKPDIVHAHTYYNSAFSMLAAKKVGIKTRIIHSHNTKSNVQEGFVYNIYIRIMKYLINKYSNVFFACGNDAGKALFYKKNKYEVIFNGIETERFFYNEEIRKIKRKELNIKDEFVIGHVGRFMPVKNQAFLVEIFSEYLKNNPNSKLIFIGEGPTKQEVQSKVLQNNIKDKVMFLGVRKDVDKLYNAMDLFMFPSLFEGFPVTLVETQINSLKALVSQNVDKTVKKSDYIEFFNVDDNVETIVELIKKNEEERDKNTTDLKDFDIKETVKEICKYYEGEKK